MLKINLCLGNAITVLRGCWQRGITVISIDRHVLLKAMGHIGIKPVSRVICLRGADKISCEKKVIENSRH